MSQFEVGDIIRFTSIPIHYAVSIQSKFCFKDKRKKSAKGDNCS